MYAHLCVYKRERKSPQEKIQINETEPKQNTKTVAIRKKPRKDVFELNA